MEVERWTDERLDQFVTQSALASAKIEANFERLQEGQAMLVQMFAEDREQQREWNRQFKQWMDRTDQQLAEQREINAQQREINAQQREINDQQREINDQQKDINADQKILNQRLITVIERLDQMMRFSRENGHGNGLS